MGMAAVYGITQSHGGYIEMGNLPQGGAFFILNFPAVEGELQDATAVIDHEIKGRGEKILIVDDEDVVRDVTGAILKNYGYEVLYAVNSEEALEILSREVETALVLLDLIMPGMSGIELSRVLSRKFPNVRIILVSGFSEPLEKSDMVGVDGFIQKPFTAEALNAKIREILDIGK